MGHKIAVTTSTFGECDSQPLDILKREGWEVCLNPHGRKLKSDELLDLAQGCSGLIAGTESLSRQILSELKYLKVISRVGVGIDNVDLDAAKEQGIQVFRTSNNLGQTVGELTIGLILDCLRHISRMDRDIRDGIWQKHLGRLLGGSKVGVIGFGAIGREVGRLASLMGAQVFYTDPQNVEFKGFKALRLKWEDIFRTCDIISVHVPYDENTRDLINNREFEMMRPETVLINVSRGGIVNEADLYEALHSGKIACAGIDVFENEPYRGPLTELDNVVLTAHAGSYTREARIAMEKEAVDNMMQGLKNIQTHRRETTV